MDVLTCRQASVCSANAILRVPQRSALCSGSCEPYLYIVYTTHSELAKVWSALTLLGSYGGAVCTFQVEKVRPAHCVRDRYNPSLRLHHQVSGSLMSLAVDSRRFDFITAREE